MRKILATCALPYANGPIHIGHMMEHLQADFWIRFQKMLGHDCLFLCADDTHGTPIMVEARRRAIAPEQLIAEAWEEHSKDLSDFQIDYNLYSSTNSEENRILCEQFFKHMKDKGHINTKVIDQLFCEHDKMFLPDRFVKGICPKCGAKDQYGDSCDSCGATYSPADLKSPFCIVCNNPPVLKQSEQLLFKVNNFRDYLIDWLPKHSSREVANKMMEWFKEPLRDWDISRNAPYFGIQIPGHPGKYFYVWVDAPMGYISTTLQYCKAKGLTFDDYWREDSTAEVYHFIGKDITYFHTLFWPALLKTAEFRSPTQVFVHGHVTVNGEKMSKSKGTQINARTYLKHLDPMYLRYYYASKLTSGVDDLDLSLDDFVARVNSDLVGKITNLASRGAQMLNKRLDGNMAECDPQGLLLVKKAQAQASIIASHFENRDFLKAINEIRALADEANRYFDEKAPWKTIDNDPEATRQVLSTTLNLFRILAIFLQPILPQYTKRVAVLFSETYPYRWIDLDSLISRKKISEYEMLAIRIEPDKVKAMLEDSAKLHLAKLESSAATAKKYLPAASSATSSATSPAISSSTDPGKAAEVSIDDFMKVDLRVAKIIEAEEIKEADKLLRLKVDLGPLGQRQIIAGIKSAYKAETLVGRLTVVVANLAPRKMKFGISEGMVLAAGAGGSELFILAPDSGAKPGDKIK